MALFFHSFRHCDMSDLLGIPIFPLSRYLNIVFFANSILIGSFKIFSRLYSFSTKYRNERRHQAKYDEDESTLSEESSVEELIKCRFQRLDVNRQRRKSVLMRPIDINVGSEEKADTLRRYVT